MSAGKLPSIYQDASWRCTLPVDEELGRLGVGFDLPSGESLRLAIDVHSARNLAKSLTEYMARPNWIDPEKELLANLLLARDGGKLIVEPTPPDPERNIRHAICLVLLAIARWIARRW